MGCCLNTWINTALYCVPILRSPLFPLLRLDGQTFHWLQTTQNTGIKTGLGWQATPIQNWTVQRHSPWRQMVPTRQMMGGLRRVANIKRDFLPIYSRGPSYDGWIIIHKVTGRWEYPQNFLPQWPCSGAHPIASTNIHPANRTPKSGGFPILTGSIEPKPISVGRIWDITF